MSGAIFISDDLVLGACEDYLLYFVGCLRAGEGEGKEKMRSHDDFWKNHKDQEKIKRIVTVIRLDANAMVTGC